MNLFIDLVIQQNYVSYNQHFKSKFVVRIRVIFLLFISRFFFLLFSNLIFDSIYLKCLTIKMRIAHAKNSRKDDETNHDSHEAIDVYLKSDFSQDTSSIHLRRSFNSHLRRFRLTYGQE